MPSCSYFLLARKELAPAASFVRLADCLSSGFLLAAGYSLCVSFLEV